MSGMWANSEIEADYDPYAYYGGSEYETHTGDPRQDLEYERQYQSSYIVPEVIKNFLLFTQKCINEQNLFEVQNCYENGFNKLTDRFFKNSPWPEAEVIAPIVGNDQVFLILYKELYYRHVYARVQNGPSLEQRFESYYNYCNLFNYILNADGPVPLELPNQWLWDIIDEFIYQFQSFTMYRSKLGKKSEDEIEFLRTNPKIWNVHSVLNVLHSLVEKSNINRQLEVYANGGECFFVCLFFLFFFSFTHCSHNLINICFWHIFLQQNLYSRVPTCQMTTFYYVGFAYLMMRRYQDAIRTFSNILLYIQRTKQMFQSRTQLYDQITKNNDKMYTLLAICLVLHPMRIDESVHSQLREKYADKMLRMQKSDLQEFETCFSFACPKFLSPVPPNYDALADSFPKEPFKLQLRVFLEEVQQQIQIPTIRSYLKLYTTLPISKLAAFMDEVSLLYQDGWSHHKMKNLVWTKGTSGLEGEFQSASEVDFYIDGDMIHIADTKVARRYGDFFIRQIHKFDEITRTLQQATY
ncbi:hypothetical protein C0Q70_00215 [Pomacea canaliculata]|uniref:Eukaryotic translation initiation factor 3 subunit L n=1 Tax=Pomacea canaliculata TaxID=400727 RepID=A0A2T7PW29_POMCA|nr:hypothetical protein C0Q70_00215 [Pomacea canaliculata]